MLKRIHSLIDAVDRKPQRFPPTIIYNEGWMLRLVLDWFESHHLTNHVLSFRPEATWYSEALLPTPFKARYQGDPRAEARTHADGLFGHIAIGNLAKTDAQLLLPATQLVVIEAKIDSALSTGTLNAPTYDQVSRNVACVCEMLSRAKRRPQEVPALAFVLIAPKQRINAGVFTAKLDKQSVKVAVRSRVETFSPELDAWWEEWLVPILEAIRVEALSWEGLISDIATVDGPASCELVAFYDRCLKYNAARA
jgi:hypothetical protein